MISKDANSFILKNCANSSRFRKTDVDNITEMGSPTLDLNLGPLAHSCSEGISVLLRIVRRDWDGDVDEKMKTMLGLKESSSRLDEWITHLNRAKLRCSISEAGECNDPMVIAIGRSLLFLAKQLEHFVSSEPQGSNSALPYINQTLLGGTDTDVSLLEEANETQIARGHPYQSSRTLYLASQGINQMLSDCLPTATVLQWTISKKLKI